MCFASETKLVKNGKSAGNIAYFEKFDKFDFRVCHMCVNKKNFDRKCKMRRFLKLSQHMMIVAQEARNKSAKHHIFAFVDVSSVPHVLRSKFVDETTL